MAPQGFDEQAEFDLLMVRHGQAATPKDGITREQIARFYSRRNAVQAARMTPYRGGGSGMQATIDATIASGHVNFSTSGRWTYLSNGDESSRIRFSTKAEREYIAVVLGLGNLQRNY